ncbi:MAG: leucyl aminopeptidase family protein [Gemmatimonadota bacterium]
MTAAAAAGPDPLGDLLAAAGTRDEAAPDLLAVPVPAAGPVAAGAGLDSFLGAPAADIAARCDATGQPGETREVVTAGGTRPGPGRVVFLGVGNGSPAAMRRAGAALGRLAAPGRRAAGRSVLTSAVLGRPGEAVAAFAEGLLLGSYRFRVGAEPAAAGQAQLLVAAPDGAAALERAAVVAEAVALARDLANTPSAEKTPAWLADQATAVAAASGLTAAVAGEGELAARGFGGLLAVGAGSARPPRLIELRYTPPGAARHIVLVGKGITFDSGGLSLKPNDGMKLMKTDMAGGAAVIAAMSALGRLGIRARVTGLIAAAENMPSGSAMRPGDVIRHFGGRTTEVLNTDAEGRLVLADALAYADAELGPDVMVDLATLTGAARVALGSVMGALYATDDALAGALLAAGEVSGDPLWRMPLADDYTDALASPVADLANVPHSRANRAGSIDAALFLREFTGGRPWAHLDIAGAARATGDDGDKVKGATGFGTRCLLRWLADSAGPVVP